MTSNTSFFCFIDTMQCVLFVFVESRKSSWIVQVWTVWNTRLRKWRDSILKAQSNRCKAIILNKLKVFMKSIVLTFSLSNQNNLTPYILPEYINNLFDVLSISVKYNSLKPLPILFKNNVLITNLSRVERTNFIGWI